MITDEAARRWGASDWYKRVREKQDAEDAADRMHWNDVGSMAMWKELELQTRQRIGPVSEEEAFYQGAQWQKP